MKGLRRTSTSCLSAAARTAQVGRGGCGHRAPTRGASQPRLGAKRYTHLFGGTVCVAPSQARARSDGRGPRRPSSAAAAGASMGSGSLRVTAARGLHPERSACQTPDQPPTSWAPTVCPCPRATRSPPDATLQHSGPVQLSLVRALTPYTQLHQTGVCRFRRPDGSAPVIAFRR